MIINVFSLNNAIREIKNGKHLKNWISVRDLGYEHLYKDIDENVNNILKITFDDLTKYQIKNDLIHPVYKDVVGSREILYFCEEHAKQIIKFSDKVFNNNGELNIHCYAGRSRSQAIGHVLNSYYNLYKEKNENDYVLNLKNSIKKFMPNHDVLSILSNQIFLKKYF
jgi:predicted protein tyrosine phosphatase